MEQQTVINRIRDWIAAIVIGLDLCHFALRVFQAGARRSGE
jgi:hypothetical protein